MAYVTLYRKWRPQTFEDVVGQEHIIRTLTNALKDDRVAHAYIFSGPRGTGKTSVAKILAKALNCADGPTVKPCNKCPACVEITAGSSMDVVEIDAASNRGIDEIRDLREKVKFMPSGGGRKVYIIDEVHMLTPEAFNALLKMLEEPPAHVVFVLATTEPHKVLQTILSRCQRFDFHRLKTEELAGQIKNIAVAEKIDIDADSVAIIAKQAKGGMRDAISTLDQLSSYTGSKIRTSDVTAMLGMVDVNLLFTAADLVRTRDTAGILRFINEIVEAGWDLRQFSKDMTEHFRNLFVIRNTDDHAAVVNATAEELKRLEEQAAGFSQSGLTDVIGTLSVLNNEMRYAADPRLALELAMVKLTSREEGRGKRQEPESGKPEERVESIPLATPDSPPASPKAVVAEGHELDTVKRAWKAVLEQVKKKKMSTYSFILECRPVEVDGKTVVLEFNERATFHKESVEKDVNKGFIEGVLRDVTGKPYSIKCVMGQETAKDEIAASSAEQTPRNDGITRPVDKEDEEIPPLPDSPDEPPTPAPAKAAKKAEPSEDEQISMLAGLFDAKIIEKKERDS